ncbi:MAG: DNA polymerase III subunit beta [Elusimicrobia bacterium]|nr:DNA polymerase III subunit beta [Elusimicrobiota bacterium]
MKITISKEELAQGVQAIQSALSSRTTLPILLNFLLETEDRKVKVISTDLEMGVKHYINAEIQNNGAITIPAKKFADILHSLPDVGEVELSTDAGSRVFLKCGRSRFGIAGAPKSEYPILPDFNKASAFQLPAAVVGDMVRKTIFAASSDETRHVLNGVFWSAKNGVLEMVSTDGRRLAVVSKTMLPKEKEFTVIVPTKVLAEFLRLLGVLGIQDGDEEKMLVAVSDNQITFQLKGTTLLSRLVGGSFPNYEQVIPTKREVVFTAPTKDLLAVTKRASLCAVDRGGSVKYALKKGQLHVTASTQNNEFSEDLAVEYAGGDFSVAFNPQFVADALKHVDAEKAVFSMTTPVNPALVEPAGERGDYRFIVMPMRL